MCTDLLNFYLFKVHLLVVRRAESCMQTWVDDKELFKRIKKIVIIEVKKDLSRFFVQWKLFNFY